ncbi:MAG: hypothetical protein KDB24_02855 [Microthrixaceae bacterium]|nr:hypothetical protein [Microthrixaceae bacterium]
MIDGPEGQGSAVAMNSTAIVSREINFETLMGQTEFRVDPDRAHITVDSEICRGCSVRGCLIACPAQLFVPTSDGGILFNYEQCFECGSCYIVCNEEGAISWTYPEGGHGVVFHRS